MSLNTQIAMINAAICKQDGWSNPYENRVKRGYFLICTQSFFFKVICSENVTSIHKLKKFVHSKSLQKLAPLVFFPFCLFMKWSWNFHAFPNSKMFTFFFFCSPGNKLWSAARLWTVHSEDLQFTTRYCFCSRWFMVWYIPNKCSVKYEHYESYIWLEVSSP